MRARHFRTTAVHRREGAKSGCRRFIDKHAESSRAESASAEWRFAGFSALAISHIDCALDDDRLDLAIGARDADA